MCSVGTASLCRNYFVVLTLQGNATHAIYKIEEKKQYMMQDCIILEGNSREVAEQMMLKDLEQIFWKNNSSLEKFGFPKPEKVPTELELQQVQWINEERQNEQKQLLFRMNQDEPNNIEQQQTFDAIMQSVLRFNASNQDSLNSHKFHFISGPGGTGKSALFRKLQAACRAEGILISICAAITLAALLFEGATTAHSLFSYPVEEEEDIDDQLPAQCNFATRGISNIFGMRLYQMIAPCLRLSFRQWRPSRRGLAIMFSSALETLPRYAVCFSFPITTPSACQVLSKCHCSSLNTSHCQRE